MVIAENYYAYIGRDATGNVDLLVFHTPLPGVTHELDVQNMALLMMVL